MSFEFAGRTIVTDAEGYLTDAAQWSEQLMEFMAGCDGLTLTPEHRTVIAAVRAYHERYATTPAIRLLLRYLQANGHPEFNSRLLARLFPAGAALSAARYAGLPRPARCV